jgi:hypothetical protein
MEAVVLHFATLCISLYRWDLRHLDEIVAGLKRRGFTRASRSSVIRDALRRYDPATYSRASEGPVMEEGAAG